MNDLFAETPAIAQDGFDEFYARYPRKVGKGQARTAYKAAIKKETHDNIMFGLSQQIVAMESKEKQFIPHPATWLNGERWDDEPEQPYNNNGPAQNGRGMARPTATEQIADLAIRRAKARQAGGDDYV